MEKEYKVGDIYKWQGIRNGDTGTIEGGYLFIVTEIGERGNVVRSIGKRLYGVENRNQAIKKYLSETKL